MIAMLMAAMVAGQIEFEGSLKDALKHVATEGDLNVVVAGDLSEPVQVHLADMPTAEALEALAKVYQLDVQKQGKLWVVRRGTAPAAPVVAPMVAVPAAPPAPPAPPAPAKYKSVGEVVVASGEARVKSGEEAESVVAYGGNVVIEPGARVTDDAVAMAGDVIVEGVVDGDAVAMAGRVSVRGDGEVKGDKVTLGFAGMKALDVVSGGSTSHTSSHHDSSDSDDDDSKAVEAPKEGFSWAAFLVRFAALFGLGFLVTVFAPQRLKNLEAVARQEPVKSGLAGFFGLLAFVPLTVLLALTLVGIPVAVLLWLLVPLAALLGVVAMANAVGGALPTGRLRRTQAVVLAVGLLVVLLAAEVPVVGPISFTVLSFIGLGAVIRTRAGSPRLSPGGAMPVSMVGPF